MYVAEVVGGGVNLQHYLTGRVEFVSEVAAVVWCGAAIPNASLANEFLSVGFDKKRIHVIGDAFAPRRFAQALGEGHRVGREIGSPAR